MPAEAQAAVESWRDHPIAGPLCDILPLLVARDDMMRWPHFDVVALPDGRAGTGS